jgi:hypothetical protein
MLYCLRLQLEGYWPRVLESNPSTASSSRPPEIPIRLISTEDCHSHLILGLLIPRSKT